MTVASRQQFLNEHHWSICSIGPTLDEQSQASCLGNTYQLNDAVTDVRSKKKEEKNHVANYAHRICHFFQCNKTFDVRKVLIHADEIGDLKTREGGYVL